MSDADRERFRIGADGNPIYAEIFRRPATSAGGVMLAARLVLTGGVVHCPGGGTHHGRPDRASGFCYLNDPVLGMLTWLDAGLENVVYLDIDAHHGDGVQDAFADDPRVLDDQHPRGRPLAEHRGRGGSRRRLGAQLPGAARVQRQRASLPDARRRAAADRRPPAAGDHAAGRRRQPAGRSAGEALALQQRLLVRDRRRSAALAPRLVVVGGGGYNPYTVGRCWAGIWAVLNGHPIPPRLTAAAETVLRALVYNRAAGRNPPEHWFTTLRDAPREGAVRAEIERLAELALKETLSA